MPLRVLMLPALSSFDAEESGIKRVVEAYHRYAARYDIQFVDCKPESVEQYDVIAVHAGCYTGPLFGKPLVAITHGLYWSADYQSANWEWHANADVIATVLQAREVTVPSEWVAETFRRDMRIDPTVIGHGIEWEEWQHDLPNRGYVLWNKNRNSDVCDPAALSYLAQMRPNVRFVTTFAPDHSPANVTVTGVMPNERMKTLVQSAAVYLSTTKETFGIGVLEALASGTPVLGFAHGGNVNLVQHGVTGYLARPGSYTDLAAGLDYCLTYRDALSQNAREAARAWTWPQAVEKLSAVLYRAAVVEPPTVSVIIPCYNYATEELLGRAIRSVQNQTYEHVSDIVVVDDGSKNQEETEALVARYQQSDPRVRLIRQANAGVAEARNRGIESVSSRYVACLDADDWLQPEFLQACCEALEKEPFLGIAYTGLWFVKPDGSEGLSPWPDKFNYDEQLQGHNQIPTACVFRRVMWERLGGYKSRYCPDGAGEEDAEFWLRAGAYGFYARKVTDAGLFVYSWMSGGVSGNREHKAVDWTAWHPWTKDGQHPFASFATPKNKISHPVRQYDQPQVSVVIPVGPGHEEVVLTALDSLEAQTFRYWEAVVVADGTNWELLDDALHPYPYARVYTTSDGHGAGYARNRGAEVARAPLLLFLDADDWLYPEALDRMIGRWMVEENIIYSDYVGKATMDRADAEKLRERLLAYDDKRQEAVIRHYSSEYDCQRALQQPNARDPYIWNLITSLVPKKWHDEIGGFDETMVSWEDWDYWIRMARAGKCFTRIPEDLVVYRFTTGTRRETGLQNSDKLIQYLQQKYLNEEPMGCGCRKPNVAPRFPTQQGNGQLMAMATYQDSEMVLAHYDHPNRGNHKVYGMATKTYYGYRHGGDTFLVNTKDIAAQPHLYTKVETKKEEEKPAPPPPPPSTPTAKQAPAAEQVSAMSPKEFDGWLDKSVDKPFDLSALPGVTAGTAMLLQADGIHTLEQIQELGVDGLVKYKGVGENRAKAIIAYVEGQLKK